MGLWKPKSVRENAFKSKKWDEITNGRKFDKSDIPTLEILCSWHAIAHKCMEDLNSSNDGIEVAYQNDIGDVKALPQIATLKQASAEIRALNKQLGINDEVKQGDATKVARFIALRSKLNDNRQPTEESRKSTA